jgi:hypothetical protein
MFAFLLVCFTMWLALSLVTLARQGRCVIMGGTAIFYEQNMCDTYPEKQ